MTFRHEPAASAYFGSKGYVSVGTLFSEEIKVSLFRNPSTRRAAIAVRRGNDWKGYRLCKTEPDGQSDSSSSSEASESSSSSTEVLSSSSSTELLSSSSSGA